MKTKLLAITLTTLLLTSCGVFKSNKKKAPTLAEEEEETEQVATPAGSVDLTKLDGEWLVWTVGGKKVTGEERPYVHLDVTTGRMYGNTGCNTVNGRFAAGEDQTLTFTEMLTTMMACDDARYETAISRALDATRYFTLAKQGHEYYVELLDGSRKSLLTLRRHNMDFLNGSWTPVEIAGRDNDDDALRMVIDIAEKRVHGRTGCNLMNGLLLIDPDKGSSIQFLDLASTRKACERKQMAKETAFLVALESVEHARRVKGGKVVMTDKDGKTVMIIKRLPLDKQ